MELYHVINRGVDGRDIFIDTQDYARFVHDLYEFNDTSPALEFQHAVSRVGNVGRTTSYIRKKIVDIHGWALMKNHYHLLISERVKGGLTRFLRKLSGYARYFNKRHERKGTLFQGRTRKIHITRQEHFLYVLHYVHLNPLDYLPEEKRWRERDKDSIHNLPKVLEYLNNYRWSSYLDYCGKRNFPSMLNTSLFERSLGDDYASAVQEYLLDSVEDELESKLLEIE